MEILKKKKENLIFFNCHKFLLGQANQKEFWIGQVRFTEHSNFVED